MFPSNRRRHGTMAITSAVAAVSRPLALFRAGAILACCAVLGGCAASPHDGRARMAAPAPVSAVYSEMNMQLTLVTMRDGTVEESGTAGDAPDAFEQRVARVGAKLAEAAFQLYPELRDRVESFEFVIADKAEPGTVSTSFGRAVILRPVSALAPTEAALAFILAREMGHVIADHHAENTAASLAVSGLAYILFPFAGLAKVVGSVFVPGGAAAGASSSIAANASATAASLVGTRIVVFSYRPKQQKEADAIALKLLGRLAYGAAAVVAAFAPVDLKTQANDWLSALEVSVDRLAADNFPFD